MQISTVTSGAPRPHIAAQTLDLYGLKYTISDDTVLRWKHEAGGENKSREKTYMHDKHEADEVRAPLGWVSSGCDWSIRGWISAGQPQ